MQGPAAVERRSPARIDADLKVAHIHANGDMLARMWCQTVKWVTLGIIGWKGFDTISAAVYDLAGKTTKADINMSAQATLDVPHPIIQLAIANSGIVVGVLGFTLFVFATFYARYQSRLRKDVVEKFHRYQRAAELAEDPNRTSSELTPRGDTRPEDIV